MIIKMISTEAEEKGMKAFGIINVLILVTLCFIE
jgi:hypothetical protein